MPGVRVPGAFDGFEIAVRAIVGQQVTVKGATTLAGRLAAAYGESIVTPYPHLTRITVRASTLAAAPAEDIAQLGVTSARARSLVALARAYAAGTLHLEPGASERTVDHLVALPGIGPWTAHYMALRALGMPDAFPAGDLVLQQVLGEGQRLGERATEARSQAWRPWRAYAVLHLWHLAAEPNKEPEQ
jgi:AraC family transcriptional regulator of adaptative response / DNA-3-methyladenine glycosylase II